MDETYIKGGKRWRYLYRAIDDGDRIVDVYFSERRDASVAQAFFEAALDSSRVPPTWVTSETAKGELPALRAVLPDVEHRAAKYLNNGLERDHQQW